MLIAPESEWGERMAGAFTAAFTAPSGKQPEGEAVAELLSAEEGPAEEGPAIIESTRFPESESDHGPVLERALRIDRSKARKDALERVLQQPVTFEPVRREDVDAIFMAATAAQARLLRPQLRFHDAGDIPVYATARIYTGVPDRAGNNDLNGVRFPASPWMLEHSRPGELPNLESLREGSFASLFALGRDAWNVLPWLNLMHRDPDFRFPGASGTLRIDGGSDGGGTNRRLRRVPQWAEFVDGLPVALEAD
jgi:outer membrane PBP1 activator LpoA protein